MADPRSLHRYEPGQPHWWQWLTVLSLDAPLVAVAWQVALARSAGVPLGGSHVFILGASVWLAYVADRWIEGWRLDPAQVQTQRHWFYQKWRRPVAAIWTMVLGAAVALSLAKLTSREYWVGLILLVPVLLYLLSHQLIHRGRPWRAPKEICVALLFTAGVACFPAADHLPALAAVTVPLALFGLLCFADCALISLWEDAVDRSHGQTSLASQFPRGGAYVRLLPWLIAIVAAIFALAGEPAARNVTGCAAASGVLLGLIDRANPRLGRQLSRVLADVALMTPFVLLVAGGAPPA